MSDDYDQIDPPGRKREFLIPRSKTAKREAQQRGWQHASTEDSLPSTMVDLSSLPTKGDGHAA